ncbi:hypothetical protein Q8A67_001373 [Cirrhinus molitorella]|uniref:AIG1-type G domain-containing protein n=1 Tax=Cirrhinus molitorella TaxID=172907 RepID=A0AA88QRB2_9TELE|nr:hypothetical protein Q8A67_001373 [Cirrhinus molitorella]
MAHSALIAAYDHARSSSWSIDKPPVFSEVTPLKIVLLGKSVSENSRVGNFILGRAAFDSEATPGIIERLRGRLEDRHVIIINSPQLLQTNISDHQITQTVRECVNLSDPGPHVFIVTLQHNDFTEEELRRVKIVLKEFSDEAIKRTLVITTNEETHDANELIQELNTECGGGHLQLDHKNEEWCSILLQRLEKILGENSEEYLTFSTPDLRPKFDRARSKEDLRKMKIENQMLQTKVGRSLPEVDRPIMSDLRIVLLGKSVSENSRVGNFLLGEETFDSDPTSAEKKLHQHRQKVGEGLKDRLVTIINCPQLLQPHVSSGQITQTVRECVNMSAPGPHVFILVLQRNDFTVEDRYRVEQVLKEFSDKAIRHTLVIMTDEETFRSKISSYFVNKTIHQLIKECGGGHLKFNEKRTEWQSEIFKMVDEKITENSEEYLICNVFHEPALDLEEHSRSEENQESSYHSDDERPEERQKESNEASFSGKQKLNLVLCGSDTLTDSVSKLLRGKKIKPSHKETIRSERVWRTVEIHDHLISVVELPGLNRLSEEEVMHQVFCCLTLCDPGIHAFIIIVPVGPLTDEVKAEVEKIKIIFDSREHFILLFTTDLTDEGFATEFVESSTDSRKLISLCGGQYSLMGLKEPENSGQISGLLDYIENVKTEPYSPQMYMRAQENRIRQELEEQHKNELSKMETKIKELEHKIQSDGSVHTSRKQKLCVVLCGSDGRLKAFVSKLIRGKKQFLPPLPLKEKCVKRDIEIHGHLISLVELPSLTRLSEEEVMHQTHQCVSLCDPGVHVFLLIIPDASLTDADKAEMEMIQRTFSSRIKNHLMVLTIQEKNMFSKLISSKTQMHLQSFEGRQFVLENGSQVPDLLQDVEKMVQENRESCYTSFMYLQARVELERNKHRDEIEELRRSMKKTAGLTHNYAAAVRIVLLGKTANGGSFYTNEMFQQVEKNIKEEQDRIMKEKEEEIKRKEEELRAKYEAEIEQMKKENERERQEMQNELRKTEEEFRKREEEIKKETDENLQKELQRKLEEKQKLFEEENKRKEKALAEQQQNFIKYLEENHEKEKQKLQEKIQRETREQAEREYLMKLEREVAKALQEAEEQLPYIAKRARDWSLYGSFIEDIVCWITKISSKYQAQMQTELDAV